MAIDYEKDSELLKILGNPSRLKMVECLVSGECNVNKIIDIFNIPQSTVSQHLGMLKSKGVVVVRKEGVRRCYKVVDKRVSRIIKILKQKA
ncbi:MAG: hypothetical protein B1H08_00705 [Candidatus Omnitrophica bacterium 4484_171]|nr:MAG: hypothetical protein B1H08_00705 [Candidatus Omnitrophica bacterium 4484_171]